VFQKMDKELILDSIRWSNSAKGQNAPTNACAALSSMLGETSVRHRVKAMAKRRTLPVSILMQISKTTHVRFDVWP